MKIALIGSLPPNASYHDWEKTLCQQIDVTSVKGIGITDSRNLLNQFAQRFAADRNIPLTEYAIDMTGNELSRKWERNRRLIDHSDIVIAYTDESSVKIKNKGENPTYSGKGAIVVTRHTSENESTELSRDELITVEEELELVKKVREGASDSEAAKEKLIHCCQRFVKAVARKYVSDSFPLEDLIAEGNKGLIHAAYKYDETSGFKFIAYATWWIRESIRQYIQNPININNLNQQIMSHEKYKKDLLVRLKEAAPKKWDKGYSARYKSYYDHILPLKDNDNTWKNRAAAIQEYFGLDFGRKFKTCAKSIHQYAHHVNSSQLLCMMFFDKLIDDDGKAKKDMVKFVKDAFGITIHEGAQCEFEYKEDFAPYIFTFKSNDKVKTEYEGTNFDFHIADGDTELYFEIKLTEEEFKKEKPDGRHENKAELYIELMPEPFNGKISVDEMLAFYQIFRNIIRAKDSNKYVIFITDGANPSTNKDIEKFNAMLKEKGIELPANVIFTTWQEVKDKYPCELPFQFKAL